VARNRTEHIRVTEETINQFSTVRIYMEDDTRVRGKVREDQIVAENIP
jgi:hypothetical protein